MNYERNLNDYYETWLEFEKAAENSPVFLKAKENIDRADSRCKNTFGCKTHDLLIAVKLSSHLTQLQFRTLLDSVLLSGISRKIHILSRNFHPHLSQRCEFEEVIY